MTSYHIQPLEPLYRAWAKSFLEQRWGDYRVVSRGRLHDASALPGFIANQESQPVGLVTYILDGNNCELVTLDSEVEGIGIGSALVTAVCQAAIAANCQRLWLITTNDNLEGLRFYQKRGFHLVAVHANAIEKSRQLKPQIPLVGRHGILIRDEIELEMWLPARSEQ